MSYIPEYCFNGCIKLADITIPGNVGKIYNGAFQNCEALSRIIIPDSVGIIGESAFSGCSNLKTVTLPSILGKIEEKTFYECKNLESIVIPEGVGIIDKSAFEKCYGLADITILGDSTSIADTAFKDVPKASTFHTLCDTAVTTWAQERGYNVDKSDHKVVKDAAVAPTCTTAGRTEGSHCSVCGTVIVAQQTIPATGHMPVTDPAIPATCTETGLTEGSHCAVCSAILTARQAVPATGHTPVTDPAIPATCTGTGLTEGSHCAVCNAILTAQQTIPATGHIPVTDPAIPATYTDTGLTEGSHCAVCGAILVEQEVVPKLGPTGVILNKKKATLYAGLTLTLKAAVEPLEAETTLTWTSSNKKVAVVSGEGVVRALAKGTATITVRTSNGQKATCRITVPTAPSKVTLNKKKVTLQAGKNLTLKATLAPAKAGTALTWTSSNKKVATVSGKGVVTAKKPGTAKITVRTANGKKAVCTVTVKK